MEVQVEEIGSCKRKLKIQVPAEDVKSKFEENYENLRKNLELPGFRRGRVPRRLIEKRFSEDVSKDVRQALLDESFQKALEEKELQVVGSPSFEDEQAEFSAEQPFTYTVTVEIRPTFELPDYTALKLMKPSVEPAEAELTSRIDYYRHRMATVEAVQTGAEKSDYVVVNLDIKVGDNSVMKRENMTLAVESKEMLGIAVEQLQELLVAAKANDKRSLTVTLPDTFQQEEHRGAQAELSLEVKDVKRPILPEANDEWAKQMGFDSLDEFRQEIAKQIRRMKDSEAREKLRLQIRDQLSEMVPMDLPEALMQRVSEENLQRRRMIMQYQGVPEPDIETRMKEEGEKGKEDVEKNVKLYFIFDEIAKNETILVTEDELKARVDQLAANYGVPPERLWDTMSNDGRLESLRKEMVDEKIVDLLIGKAQVEQAPPETAVEEGKKTE